MMHDDYLPDPIERGEARADADAFDAFSGQPPGKWKCPGCNQIRDVNDMHPISADPYGSPGCGECLDAMIAERTTDSVSVEQTDEEF